LWPKTHKKGDKKQPKEGDSALVPVVEDFKDIFFIFRKKQNFGVPVEVVEFLLEECVEGCSFSVGRGEQPLPPDRGFLDLGEPELGSCGDKTGLSLAQAQHTKEKKKLFKRSHEMCSSFSSNRVSSG